MKTSFDYKKEAKEFLKKANVSMSVEFLRHGKMPYDTVNTRDIYNITLTNNGTGAEYTFEFGQSIAKSLNPKKYHDYPQKRRVVPTEYDVLACLQTHDPGTYGDFCSDFGLPGSEKTLSLWIAVCDEYRNVNKIFGLAMDALLEIQ